MACVGCGGKNSLNVFFYRRFLGFKQKNSLKSGCFGVFHAILGVSDQVLSRENALMAVKSGVFAKFTAETGGKNNKNRSFYRRIQRKVSRLQCLDIRTPAQVSRQRLSRRCADCCSRSTIGRSLMTAAGYAFVKSRRMNFRGWNGRSGTGRFGISSSYFS